MRTVFRSRSPRPPSDCDASASARPNLRPFDRDLAQRPRVEALGLVDDEHVLAAALARRPLAPGGVDQVAADEHRPEQVRVVAADAREIDEQDRRRASMSARGRIVETPWPTTLRIEA